MNKITDFDKFCGYHYQEVDFIYDKQEELLEQSERLWGDECFAITEQDIEKLKKR